MRAFALENLPQCDSICDSMIEAALGSAANLCVLPMQDILHLGSEARMNTPGTVGGGNWMWRMQPGVLTDELAARLHEMNDFYERTPS